MIWLVKLLVIALYLIAASPTGQARRIITVNQNELRTHEHLVEENFRASTPTEAEVATEIEPENEIRALEGTSTNRTTQARSKKKSKKRIRDAENLWFHCADETTPTEITWERNMGVMCSREYPFYTCCSNHDLTMDLLGSKIAEQIPNHRCASLLKKLRCAHCSPRSWWLFHAPDKMRLPHKRVVPIMCPAFCKNFHDACRDSIAGLQNDDFCDFHTGNEDGPCFPDYKIRRGTID